MRVVGEWAFVMVTPQRPDGGPIPYVDMRYQAAVDAGAFDSEATALLRDTSSGRLVDEDNLGAADAVWVDWRNHQPVPLEVFPGN
jgi:hypothetical protein